MNIDITVARYKKLIKIKLIVKYLSFQHIYANAVIQIQSSNIPL